MKIASHQFVALLLAGFVSGCATIPSEKAQELITTEMHLVKDCREIGDFSAGSLLSMVDKARGHYNSQIEVLERAAKAGATHVVWKEVVGAKAGVQGAKAMAYTCLRNQLSKMSYSRPVGAAWKHFAAANGQTGYCRELDKQTPPSTLCVIFWAGATSEVSNQYKTADEFFSKVKQLRTLDADSGRMKSLANNFKRSKFKKAECLDYVQKTEDLKMKEKTGVEFKMNSVGKSCLVPDDAKSWVDFSLSSRVREGTSGEFSKEDLQLLEGVEIGTAK